MDTITPVELEQVEPSTRSVKVRQIAQSLISNDLHELFVFCGKIEQIDFPELPEGSAPEMKREATIVFETVEGAQTALLLSNTELAGSPLIVELCTVPEKKAPVEEAKKTATNTTITPGGIDAPPVEFTLPTGAEPLSAADPVMHIVEVDETYQPSSLTCSAVPSSGKSSVFASLIAAGVVLGEEVAASKFAKKLSEGAEMVKQKASAIEEEYKLGDRLKEVGTKLSEKVKKWDDEVQLSERIEKATSSIPTSLSSGLDRLRVVSTQIGDAVKLTIEAQVRHVEAAIEARRGNPTLTSTGTPLYAASSSSPSSSSSEPLLEGQREDTSSEHANQILPTKDESVASSSSGDQTGDVPLLPLLPVPADPIPVQTTEEAPLEPSIEGQFANPTD